VSRGGIELDSTPQYMGTFTFAASADAQGVFTISLRLSDTSLKSSTNQSIPWVSTTPVQVFVIGL